MSIQSMNRKINTIPVDVRACGEPSLALFPVEPQLKHLFDESMTN